MIAQINDFAQIWWQWMGSMFWQVSLLIMLVTALDMAIRRWAWPQVRYALWILVFLKLIIPPTWQMPTSIVSWIQPQVEEQISIQIGVADWNETNSIIPDWNESNQKISDSNDFTQSKGNESVMVKKTKVTWQTFALFGWIFVMVIFSLLLFRKMSQFHKSQQMGEDEKIPEWIYELLKKTAKRLKLKKYPSIIFSKDAKSPAVYGVIKQFLILPEGYMEKLSGEQAEHVLIHELCHIKRGDLLVHWFCLILQIVYWFNPLLIRARRQMRHVCEICCDLSVANVLRENTFAYRSTLLKSACELFKEMLEPGLGFLGIFEEPFRFVPRLKWLEKKTWENRKLKIATTICTSLFMAACIIPMSKSSQSGVQSNTDMIQSDSNSVETNEQQKKDERGISRAMPMAGFSQAAAQNNSLAVQSDSNPVESMGNKAFKEISGNSEYLIRPLDILEISFHEDETIPNQTVSVHNNGKINLLYTGELYVGDLTTRELDAILTEMYSDYIIKPSIDITIKEYKNKRVTNLYELIKQEKSILTPEAQLALQEVQELFGQEDFEGTRKVILDYFSTKPEIVPEMMYLMLGYLCYQDHNIEEVIKIFEKGYAAFPESEKMVFNYAIVLYEGEQFDKSATIFENVYEIMKKKDTKYLNNAVACYYLAEKFDEAKRVIKRMIKMSVNPEKTWYDAIILIAREQERLEEAKGYAMEALDVFPLESKYWKFLDGGGPLFGEVFAFSLPAVPNLEYPAPRSADYDK